MPDGWDFLRTINRRSLRSCGRSIGMNTALGCGQQEESRHAHHCAILAARAHLRIIAWPATSAARIVVSLRAISGIVPRHSGFDG